LFQGGSFDILGSGYINEIASGQKTVSMPYSWMPIAIRVEGA
jgi:hypothetical protein